jgi:5-methylcytosine-specific restriction endonuclease McrA
MRGNTRVMPVNTEAYGETAAFDAPSFGAYMLLRMHHWITGSLPKHDDESALAAITKSTRSGWRRKIWPSLRYAFEIGDDGCLCNPQWEEARANRRNSSSRELDVSRSEWEALRAAAFERDNYTCVYCSKPSDTLHCDHIIPLSRDGKSVLDNLATSCSHCNTSKGAMKVDAWLEMKRAMQ